MAEPTMMPPLLRPMHPAIHAMLANEDNWQGKTSPAERRKIQNKLNQRTWRQRRKQEKQQKQRQQVSHNAGAPTSASSQSHAGTLIAFSRWATAGPATAAFAAYDGADSEHAATRPGLPRRREDPRICAMKATLMALTYLGRDERMIELQEEDMDELYRLFLQRAYENQRRRSESTSPNPMADSLLPLVQFNLFRGLMENSKTLGITLSMICDDDCISPYGGDPAYRARTRWSLPFFLRPTGTQLTAAHHPWVDLIPLPRLRDNLIKAGGAMDDEFCLDLIGNGDAPSGQGGMILWGEPWDPKNWEVTEDFVLKWRWILKGCGEMIASSNYWRAKRGERKMRVKL